jgi:hypothetical protein
MLRVKFSTFATIGVSILISSPDRAQVQTRPPEFEVATVKVNKDGRAGSLVRTPGGLTATNAEFSRLIEMAFQTRSLDLSAVPEALRMERFDIAAKASGKDRRRSVLGHAPHFAGAKVRPEAPYRGKEQSTVCAPFR